MAGEKARKEESMIRPGEFRCAMCGGVFLKGQADADAYADAYAEAIMKGIAEEELDDDCLVCDDCYKLAPWGADPSLN